MPGETGLKVYNSLSRKLETFKPIKEKHVRMFVCGQTVYDDAHIGHAKTYINFDIVARWLRESEYDLFYVQNITDVDDKIIVRAQEKNVDPLDLARGYENRFLKDMDRIGVNESVDDYPRSHDFIEEIKDQIQVLLDKNYAYLLGGDIYFDVARFKEYTLLSGMKIEELEKHRIEPKEGKKNVYDFALWKEVKEGEPSWEITLKSKNKNIILVGRPGWHIEDTAMAWKIFGKQYDLHGGGRDLIFPHHTNEIAQAEAAFGKKPFVKYWLHSGTLNIKGAKMSKSLKNFVKINDFVNEYGSDVLRLMVASSHYRKDIDYEESIVKEAVARMRYVNSSLSVLYNAETSKTKDERVNEIINKLGNKFTEAMNDDFNTSLALSCLVGAIEELRRIAENGKISKESKGMAVKRILKLASILGILREGLYKKKLPKEAYELIKQREALRARKKFGEADNIRYGLKEKFKLILEDSEKGTIWYFLE